MIITCPNCNSEYDILETALGDAGREVKCVNCTHKWFAEPENVIKSEDREESEELIQEEIRPIEEQIIEEAQADPEEDIVEEEQEQEDVLDSQLAEEAIDIPDSVKPIQEDEMDIPVVPESLQAKMTGYGIALVIFGLFAVYIFANKNDIIQKWLPSAAFYEMAGIPAKLKGEGLIVESLSATVLKNKEQHDVLIVKGRVVNLTKEAIQIPKMKASIRTTNGDDAENWIIDPPVEVISAGESFAFTTDYPNVGKEIGSVNLAFVPTLKQ